MALADETAYLASLLAKEAFELKGSKMIAHRRHIISDSRFDLSSGFIGFL